MPYGAVVANVRITRPSVGLTLTMFFAVPSTTHSAPLKYSIQPHAFWPGAANDASVTPVRGSALTILPSEEISHK